MSKSVSYIETESIIGQSPFEFKELVVHILSQLCTSQVDGKTNAMDVSRLRGVNRTFRDEIDTSLLLWRFIMRYTRRAMIEPSVPIPINTISEMKEFIILDSEEFTLRDYLFSTIRKEGNTSPCIGLGDQYALNYRMALIVDRHTHKDYQGILYNHDIRRYREIVIKLDRLCPSIKIVSSLNRLWM